MATDPTDTSSAAGMAHRCPSMMTTGGACGVCGRQCYSGQLPHTTAMPVHARVELARHVANCDANPLVVSRRMAGERAERAEQALASLQAAVSSQHPTGQSLDFYVNLARCHREDSEQVDEIEAEREQAQQALAETRKERDEAVAHAKRVWDAGTDENIVGHWRGIAQRFGEARDEAKHENRLLRQQLTEAQQALARARQVEQTLRDTIAINHEMLRELDDVQAKQAVQLEQAQQALAEREKEIARLTAERDGARLAYRGLADAMTAAEAQADAAEPNPASD